jgi:succinoglycan biosynthesis protein ExoO
VPPLVSFIVPTLNRVRYVTRAVDSCLRAGDVAGVTVEVIVLDSHSADGSWECLVDRYQNDLRVTLLQNERNAGPTASWLAAARLAMGNYRTFVWSDDYLAPHFLSDLYFWTRYEVGLTWR